MPDLEIPVGDEQLPTKERKKYERKPTVRFTVEEARIISRALTAGQFDWEGWSDECNKLAPVIQRRLAKFIEKFGTIKTEEK